MAKITTENADVETVKETTTAKVRITNKVNRSIEVCIWSKYYRLEPFGKDGCSLVIDKDNLKFLFSDLENLEVQEVK